MSSPHSKPRVKGITTIALTGTGAQHGGVADILIDVPSSQTALVQECHIALGHAITAAVETLLGFRD